MFWFRHRTDTRNLTGKTHQLAVKLDGRGAEQPTLTDRFSNSAHFSLTLLFSSWRLINTLQEREKWGEEGLV